MYWSRSVSLKWDVLVSQQKVWPAPPLLRVLLDRAHTGYDNIFHGLDPETLDLPLPPSPPPPTATSRSSATDKFASTSETNTSDRSSSSSFNSSLSSSSPSSTDLSQILLNIKSSRWRHFRPRTLPLHELDNAHPLFRRLSRGLKRPVSASAAGGQPFGSQRLARVVPAPSPIAGKRLGCLQTAFKMWFTCSALTAAWGGRPTISAVISSDLIMKIFHLKQHMNIFTPVPPLQWRWIKNLCWENIL